MKGHVHATKQVPPDAVKLAAVRWKDFPNKGDSLNSVLFKDREGNYFVQEVYNWSDKPFLIPKSKNEAELYYFLYAEEVFNEF